MIALKELFTAKARALENEQDKRILSSLNPSIIASLPHTQGRMLWQHLSATRGILRAWEQPAYIQMAGLCHSIYSTPAYKHQAVFLEERERVSKLIGAQAERLVYLFSLVPRLELFRQARSQPSLRAGATIAISTAEEPGDARVEITGDEAAALVMMHLANTAEQSAEKQERPGIWLSQFSIVAVTLHKSDLILPKPVTQEADVLSRESELALRDGYSNAIVLSLTEPAEALREFRKCGALCSWIAEPYLWSAYILMKSDGDRDMSMSCARTALANMDKWATAWDKRIEFSSWRKIAKAIAQAEPLDQLGRQLEEIAASESRNGLVVKTQTAGQNQGLERFMRYLGRIAQERTRSAIGFYPGLSRLEYHDPARFSVTAALESSFERIREEVLELNDELFHSEAEDIKRKGGWKVFMFYEAGQKREENCIRCPTITRIIEEHSCVRRAGGLIYVSRLTPHTEVAAHRGPTNIRVRCHLAIQIPDGDCGLRVGNTAAHWSVGKCLVFDDHFRHEVWNRTDSSRIVLLIDLWHPDLTHEERVALEALHWCANYQGQGLAKYWVRNERQYMTENGRGRNPGPVRIHATEAGLAEVDMDEEPVDH